MVEPSSCGFCRDLHNRNFGHLEYVAVEDETGIHLLRCPMCGTLYEDDSHNDPLMVPVERAVERWGYGRGLPSVSFHDSEVLCLRIDRRGPTLELDIEAFAQTDRAARYRLRFVGVDDLELGDVNEQNVLFDLTAEESPQGWEVRLNPSYGVYATFKCRDVIATSIT
jgi:hypothetical protein